MTKFKPFLLLYVIGIILLILSFIDGRRMITIHLNDTYYVMAMATLYTMLSLILLLFGIVYHMTQKMLLSPILTWIHVIASIITAVLIICIPVTENSVYTKGSPSGATSSALLTTMVLLVGVGIICQLLFPLNTVGGALKKGRNNP